MNDGVLLEFKGGRFLGAEKLLNDELNSLPNYETYFNLMICKLNLICDEGRTIDEVIYCFEKSLELVDDNKKEELLLSVKKVVKNITTQLGNLYQHLEVKKQEQNRKNLFSNLVGIASVLAMGISQVSSSQTSSSTKIAQAAFFGGSVGLSIEGLKKINGIKESQQKIFDVGNQIIDSFVHLGIGTKNELNSELFIISSSIEKLIGKFGSEELKKISGSYLITSDDLIRMSQIANSMKTISFKNFKENELLKKEWKLLMEKYKVSFSNTGVLLTSLKKNPIH